MTKSENYFLIICLLLATILNGYFSSLGFLNDLMDAYAFRQTQTAISTLYLIKEGLTINYITPVLGAPWSIPLEFPSYQIIVAFFSSVTHVPLDQSGRIISIVFFYIAVLYIYRIFKLFFDKYLSIIPIALLLVSPQYIYWSRTFMIESTALCFGVAHLFYLLSLRQVFNYKKLILCIVFGVLGSLTKITTYFVIVFPFCIFVIGKISIDLKDKKCNLLSWLKISFPIVFSMIVAVLWTKYCDYIKNLNPLAQGFITSESLTQWNFGTLQQRTILRKWEKIFTWSFQYGVGSNYVLMILPLWFAVISRFHRTFIGLLLTGFFVGPLVFFNLYYVHSYYHYGNILFLVLAIGVCIIGVVAGDKESCFTRHVALWLIFPVVMGVMIFSYRDSNYYKLQKTQMHVSPIIKCIRENIPDTGVLLIYDHDWSPELPYHLQRKAIMDRENRALTDPKMKASLEKTGKDVIIGIIKKNYNETFRKEVAQTFNQQFLNLSSDIYIREDYFKSLNTACSYDDKVK